MKILRTGRLLAVAGIAAALTLGGRAARGSGLLAAAEAAFEEKDYATALPLLQELLEDHKDERAVWLEIKKRELMCKDHLTAEEFVKLSWKPGMPRIEPKRAIHTPPKAGEVLSLGIKQLGNFDYDADKGGAIPEDVKALSGSKVKLWGYMIPMREAENVTEFALVPSAGSCCFGQPPSVQHTIMITMAKGTFTSLTREPINVTGVLKVEEERHDDFTSGIFSLNDAAVEETPKEVKQALGTKGHMGGNPAQ